MNDEIKTLMTDQVHNILHKAEDGGFDPSAYMERRDMNLDIQNAILRGVENWVNCHDTGQTQHEMEQRRRMAPVLFFTGMAAAGTFLEARTASGIILAVMSEEPADPTPRPPNIGDILRDILRGKGN